MQLRLRRGERLNMATNPQYPESRGPEPPDVHPKLKLTKKSRVPWPLLIIVVAAAVLAGFIYWLPQSPRQARTPSAAQVPAQPTGSQIQLTNTRIVPDVNTGTAYLLARVVNAGNTTINGMAVDATFKNLAGQNLETERAKVMGIQQQGTANRTGAEQDLTQDPIKPGAARTVRIDFTHVPQGWNLQVPEIKIVTVTAQGGAK